MIRKLLVTLALLANPVSSQLWAFDAQGHSLVGAVADQRLKSTPAAAEKVKTLLDGMTLEQAAVLPDEIKKFDVHPDLFKLPGHPTIQAELIDFLKANPHTLGSATDHHAYHFVDIPVGGDSTYASGTVGRSDHDLVQMIPFCVGVLNGSKPADNPRKITRAVAVILLAHYVGDLHQPLHVGAQYFDNNRAPTNPDTGGGPANGDTGGNSLILHLQTPSGAPSTQGDLHGYWDKDAVITAFQQYRNDIVAAGDASADTTDSGIAKFLAAKTPTGWSEPTGPMNKWAQVWADEIMPMANEAHSRLEYSGIIVNASHHSAAGQATERPISGDTSSYKDFAGKVVHDSMHRAGWRLALVLQKVLP